MDRSKWAWSVRQYRPGDEKGIIDLCRVVFAEQSADRFTLEYWNWEFAANSSGPARVWVADDHGRVVGHYAVVPRWVQVGSDVRTGSIVVDVMTDPNYRMQGMFVAIGREAVSESGNDGIEFCYGFPVRNEVMPGHLKVGWQHAFDIPVWVRPLRFEQIVRRYISSPLFSSLLANGADLGYSLAVRPMLRSLHPSTAPAETVSIREINAFDARFDELWLAAKCQVPIMGVRDRTYLQWRYMRHPYYSYRVLVAEQDDRLLGYIVTRTGELLGLKSGIIVDLLVHPDSTSCVDLLVANALAGLEHDDQLELVASMMTDGTPYTTALQRHGFIRSPQVFWFIIHLNNENAPRQTLLASKNWYLTWGDTDVI